MKILLVGSGAREHAIASALMRHQQPQIYNIASQVNPGIQILAQDIQIMPFDQHAEIVAYAQQQGIDWAIIGPEKPLESGLSDSLQQVGIPVIGPTQRLAQIETSKGFTRDLMQKYHIVGLPWYRCFERYNEEVDNCLAYLGDRYVIKMDGLMSGKGVKVAGDHLHSVEEAVAFCQSIQGPFVIEEKLCGPEFSLMSFCDGQVLRSMPAVQDHKRLCNGDQGPNTGGMGSYTLANHRLPFLTEADMEAAHAINVQVLAALQEEIGESYCGILYGSFMKTEQGIQVIEYNARFGDPEVMNVLGLLETDFVSVCEAMLAGRLADTPVTFRTMASVCKYLVPPGYPDHPQLGGHLQVPAQHPCSTLYYASVEESPAGLKMLGSRALAVVATDPQIDRAEQRVEATIQHIQGEFVYRSDIAKDKQPNTAPRARIAILGSTQGSNLLPLLNRLETEQVAADVVVVLSDQPESGILQKAQARGLAILSVPKPSGMTRSHYGVVLAAALEPYQVDMVVLIGFMRILAPTFLEGWPGKIINVHPSLLPRHAGLMDLQVHQAVLDAQEKQTGCTVHQVDTIVDGGPILVQKTCAVDANDTPEQLKAKVQALEVPALVEAIQNRLRK